MAEKVRRVRAVGSKVSVSPVDGIPEGLSGNGSVDVEPWGAKSAPKGSAREQWAGVIGGTVEIDVGDFHSRIEEALRKPVAQTASAILTSIERVSALFLDANKLAARARRDYDLLKEEHETWLEAKRTASRMALQEAKEDGQIKKQITEGMVMDQVRATWPDEYIARMEKLKDFQATVHVLEAMPEAVKMRARSLDAQKDALLAQAR